MAKKSVLVTFQVLKNIILDVLCNCIIPPSILMNVFTKILAQVICEAS